MTVINSNIGSLYAQQAMNTNARGLSTVMQQLSTGKRINNAVDDVAGMSISTRLRPTPILHEPYKGCPTGC